MYSKDSCPFCKKAADFFNQNKIKFHAIDLSDDNERQKFYNKSGTNSVPQIYYDDIRIGGYTELIKSNLFKKPRLLQEKEAYIFDYKEAVEFADTQNDVFWTHKEIDVEKDVQDIMVNLSEAERHGVISVLKLFTLYEIVAGEEYWGGRVKEAFPRHDIRLMASSFSFMETNVHARFYNKLNEALHLNTEEFYTDYVNDPTLKSRMEFVDKAVEDDDLLKSLAVFAMVEGAVLYSSFAFLKHFQANGKNKLVNVVRGIDFSVRDENLHHLGGAWLYRQLKEEMREIDQLGDDDKRTEEIYEAARQIYEHESRIVDMIFEKGKIEGISKTQMNNFIASRVDECLVNLGLEKIYKVTYNPIADWFYKSINSYAMHDFFTGIGNSYNRDWNERGFEW